MSLSLLLGVVIALLAVGIPLWAGVIQPRDPLSASQRGRALVLQRSGGNLCTLAGVLSTVCALASRGVLSGTTTLVVFLLALHAGLGFVYLRVSRATARGFQHPGVYRR